MGSVRELFVFHNPWVEVMLLEVTDNNPLKLGLRAIGYGMPETITFMVVGAVILFACHGLRDRSPDRRPQASMTPAAEGVHADVDSVRRRTIRPLVLLSGATMLGVFLYPPALRLYNAASADIDFGIVNRYSMAFAPLIVWLALLGTSSSPWFARLLAVVGALGVGALCVGAW